MHADQVDVPLALVRRLVDQQFPQWAGEPLAEVAEHGTDHRLFRLGDDLLVRLPVYGGPAHQAARDAEWLPRLAPHLPVEVPVPVALGEPDEDYPFPWSVVPWLPGTTVDRAELDPDRLADDLADAVLALRQVDTTDAPRPEGTSRGVPLEELAGHADVEAEIAEMAHLVDADAALRVWRDALDAGPWTGEPVWLHGDLLEGNLLSDGRRLTALVDFLVLGVGDPALDVMPAFTLFDGPARQRYRAALAVDDATWARAKAWVMLPALTGLEYYAVSAPAFSARARRHLDAVLGAPG